MSLRIPKYRLHKGTGQALVQINGKRTYLGKHGSVASKEKYRRLIAELYASQANPKGLSVDDSSISINELILAFWPHVEERYVKNGRPTSERTSFKTALWPLRNLYGTRRVADFGPRALIACRQQLIDKGICRKRINQHITRVRQMFKWGVAHELVPETVWRALSAVEGLRVGEALETAPVRPVPEEHIPAIEPYVTPQIWGMVNLQLWTACRPGEACLIRGVDLNMAGDIWEYIPLSHKTEHYERTRIVFLGPHAQDVIIPWLKTNLDAYLFSPREARAWFQAQRAKKRKTAVQSKRKSKRKANPKRAPGESYSTISYDHAIRRACEKAGIPNWAPNQLRHNAATRIRAAYGIEATRIILGHASAVTSEIYAEADREKAREIMRKLG